MRRKRKWEEEGEVRTHHTELAGGNDRKEKEVYDLLLLLEGGNMKPLVKEKETVISGTVRPLCLCRSGEGTVKLYAM